MADLRHAFGRRLPAAGVSFEDRQGLPGQRSTRVTTDHGGAELRNWRNAANVGKMSRSERSAPDGMPCDELK